MRYTLEGITPELFNMLWLSDAIVQTESGPQSIREHYLRKHHRDHQRHAHLYCCQGCKRICCACFGGAEDPRCDDCVVEAMHERTAGAFPRYEPAASDWRSLVHGLWWAIPIFLYEACRGGWRRLGRRKK